MISISLNSIHYQFINLKKHSPYSCYFVVKTTLIRASKNLIKRDTYNEELNIPTS